MDKKRDTPNDIEITHVEEKQEKPKPKIKLQIKEDGEGDFVKAGDRVYVYYRGMLTNGDVFDSNENDKYAMSFVVGNDEVIEAWDKAFLSMQVGTAARIVSPPEYAFGNEEMGDGLIPANSTLIFDVEIVDIKRAKK